MIKKLTEWIDSHRAASILIINILFCALSSVFTLIMHSSLVSIAIAAFLWIICQGILIFLFHHEIEWKEWIIERWYVIVTILLVMFRALMTLGQCWMSLEAGQEYAALCVVLTVIMIYGISAVIELIGFTEFSFSRLFAVQALLSGFVLSMIFPLFTIADEPRHMRTVYELSNDIMGIDSPDNSIYMRSDDADYYFSYPEYTLADTNAYLKKLSEPLKNGELVLVHDGDAYDDPAAIENKRETPYPTDMYQYIMPAIGLTLGRAMHLNTPAAWLLGRMCSLILYTAVITFALAIMPVGKSVLYTAALLPMSLQLAGSLSRDVFRICMAVLSFALTMYLFYSEREKVRYRNSAIAGVVVSSALLLPVRTFVYAPLALLPLFILIHRKNWIPVKAAVYGMIAIVLLGVLALGVKYIFFPGEIVEEPLKMLSWMPEYRFTIQHFINYPLDLAWLLRNTFWMKTIWYGETMIGSLLGWLDVSLTAMITTLFAFMLVISAAKRDYETVQLSPYCRTGLFLIAVISALMIVSGMIITWTPVTSITAEGVQGRYFLPLLVPVLMTLRGKSFMANKKCDMICACVIFAALIYTNVFMMLRLL